MIHWNGNVIILTKSSSLAAPQVVKMTTFGAASDENFVKMATFLFHCTYCYSNKIWWHMAWTGFPHNWPSVKRTTNHRWISPHKSLMMWNRDVFSDVCWNKLLDNTKVKLQAVCNAPTIVWLYCFFAMHLMKYPNIVRCEVVEVKFILFSLCNGGIWKMCCYRNTKQQKIGISNFKDLHYFLLQFAKPKSAWCSLPFRNWGPYYIWFCHCNSNSMSPNS